MAAANLPNVQQPTPHEAIVGPTPPVVPDNAPAPPVAMHPPANAPQGAPAPLPHNAGIHIHQAAHAIVAPVIPNAPFLAPGTSPLHRSLYGLPFGN